MAFKRFTRGEMVSVSGPWVDPAHPEHQTLAGVPEIAPLLHLVARAHRALLDTQLPADTTEWTELRAARDQASRTHGRLARAIRHLLQGYIHLDSALEDPRAAALVELQGLMFPEGLRVVQRSHRETAGEAQLLASALTPARQEVLAGLPTDKGSLLDAVCAWIEAGRQLGALSARLMDAPSPATGAARARNQWIRVMNAMRIVMEHQRARAPELGPILERLEGIQAQVDRRRRRRAGGARKSQGPAPAPGEGRPDHGPLAPGALASMAGKDPGDTGELTLA